MTDVTPTTWSEFQAASWLRARREGLPLSGTFELTPLCNFRCRMCYVRVDALPEGSRLRTAEEWLDLARQAAERGMYAVTLTGEGFILIAAISYAVSSALIHTYSQREDPVALSGYQFVLGGAALTLAGAVLGGNLPRLTPAGIAMVLYLACVSGVAYSLWSILLKYNPTSRVAIFGFMNPVFGVVLSSILLGEGASMPWLQTALALVLIALGIVIVNRPEGDAAPSPSAGHAG